jgi:hypothetical protein
MPGRLRRSTSVSDLLVFILVAAIVIMEVATITTPIAMAIIIIVIIRITTDIIEAAGTPITAEDMDITEAPVRCRPFN